ncbi:MAG: extracellular solute-binding protein [Lachnospiraceae bacterium]|nr:extracellular solute-binding protein [Lachnospiraceae bacterium]
MKKSITLGLVTIIVVGMAMSMMGCGKSAVDSSSKNADKVTVSFWHKYCQPGQVEVFEEICKDYEKEHPNVEIKITTTTDDDMKTKLQVALGSEDLPDVYQTWSGEYCEKFARGGYALDLTTYLEEDKEWKESFYPACYSAFTYGDKQYALPTRFDSQIFVYKKSLFEKYGLKEPGTWDELMDICETLKENGEIPFILGDGLTWDAPHWYGSLWQRCIPEEILEQQDFNIKTVKLDDPRYIKGLNYFTELVDKGYFKENCVSLEHNMALETFYAGEGTMAYVEVVEFNDINKGLNGDFGFFSMPKMEGEAGNQEKTFGAPEGMIVNAKSEHVEESVDFLKYLTSLDVQKKLVEEAKHTSSVIGATTEENAIPQLVEVMNMIMKFSGMSNWTDCGLESSLVDVMRAQGQEFYAGKITAEEYMKQMQDAATKVREKNQ